MKKQNRESVISMVRHLRRNLRYSQTDSNRFRHTDYNDGYEQGIEHALECVGFYFDPVTFDELASVAIKLNNIEK